MKMTLCVSILLLSIQLYFSSFTFSQGVFSPPIPNVILGCDTIITTASDSIIIDENLTYCLTDTFTGVLLFTGAGGRLCVYGQAVFSEISTTNNLLIDIEVMPSGVVEADAVLLVGKIKNCGVMSVRTITIAEDYSFTNSGSLFVSSDLYNFGSITADSSSVLRVDGTLYNRATSTLDLSGSLQVATVFKNFGNFINRHNSNVLVGGYFSNYKSGMVENLGLLSVDGVINNYGILENYGMVSAQNDVSNDADLLNDGVMQVAGNVINTKSIDNRHSLTIVGSFTNSTEATLVNNGLLDIGNNLINYHSVLNNDSIFVRAKLYNKPLSEFVNQRFLSVENAVLNNGVCDNRSNAVFNIGVDLFNYSIIVNAGDVQIHGSLVNESFVENYLNALFIVGSNIVNKDSSEFLNVGHVDVQQSFKNYGYTSNVSGAIISICNYFSNYQGASVVNGGVIYVSNDFNNYGELVNNDSLLLDGYLNNQYGALVVNTAILDVGVSIKNYADLENLATGSVSVFKNVNNYSTANFTNNGQAIIRLNFDNSGSAFNVDGGLLDVLDIVNNSTAELSNSARITLHRAFKQYGLFINSGLVDGTHLFNSFDSSLTSLHDGALINCENLQVAGRITGVGKYSSIYVRNLTSLNSSSQIDGLVDVYDENGIESQSGSIAESVIFEQPISNAVLSINDEYAPISFTYSGLNLSPAEGALELMFSVDSISGGGELICNTGAYALNVFSDSLGELGICFTLNLESGSSVSLLSDSVIACDSWYHVVVVWESDFLYLYINGVLEKRVSKSANMVDTESDIIFIANSKDSFIGRIDNVRLWDRSLSGNEIWDMLFAEPLLDNRLFLNLTFDEILNGGSLLENHVGVNDRSSMLLNSNDLSQVVCFEDVMHSFSVLNRYITYGHLFIPPSQALVVDDIILCNSFVLYPDASLVVSSDASLIVAQNFYSKNTIDMYGVVVNDGVLNIGHSTFLEQPFKGDGSWEFKTVAAPVVDFSILGRSFDTDFAVYYYSESIRSESGCVSDVWQIPTVLEPSVGYIFAFAEPKSIVHIFKGSCFDGIKPVQIPLFNTPSAINQSHEGWNLIGNSSPFSIQWDCIVESNKVFQNESVESAIYVYDNFSKNYKSYVDGVSVNDLSGDIAPYDAFFVKSNLSNVSVIIDPTCSSSLPNFRGLQTSLSNSLSLTVFDSLTSDQAVVRYLPDAVADFDCRYDARKEFGGTGCCQLYTNGLHGNSLSVNSLDLGGVSQSVDLKFRFPHEGLYRLQIANANTFDSLNVFIVDKLTTQFSQVLDSLNFKFDVTDVENVDRFLLVFSNRHSLSFHDFNTNNLDVFYADGMLYVSNVSEVNLLTISDMSGRCLFRTVVNFGDCSFQIVLPSGVFIVNISNIYKKCIFVH